MTVADFSLEQTSPARSGEKTARPPERRMSPLSVLFGSLGSAVLTIALGAVLILALPRIIQWGVIDSVWSANDGAACREATGA